jgi:DNA replication protein DnaC
MNGSAPWFKQNGKSANKKKFARMKMGKADGSYAREIARIEKYDLLIPEDFGLTPLGSAARMMLLEIIEERHGQKVHHHRFATADG